jgi:hypothetical protein
MIVMIIVDMVMEDIPTTIGITLHHIILTTLIK